MLRITLLLVGLLLIAGCEQPTVQVPPAKPDKAVVLSLPPPPALAVRSGMLVSTQWLNDHLNDANLVVLQVGGPTTRGDQSDTARKGYRARHIPGARFVSWSDVATVRGGVPNELPPMKDLVSLARRCGITHQSRIVLYDDQSGLPSARAFVALDYLGLGDQTAMLDGLWKKWQAEHKPVSLTEPAGQPSGFVPRPQPQVILPLTQMRDMVWARMELASPPITIIDARPAEEYSGAKPGEGIRRPGHIPGAENVFSLRNVVSEDMPTLKSADELRNIYARAGALPGSLVITYCRTGGQASLAYFAARYLGHDVRLYDGSFIEWSSQPDTEVVGP